MTQPGAAAPIVSVVMAVHNGADAVGRAIEGILRQTLAEWELIIVDDGSTDDSAKIIASYADGRIRYLRNECNLGVYIARNRGGRMARGEFIAVHDHDDVSVPARLEKQAAFLRAHPDHSAVGCWLRMHCEGQPDSVSEYPVDDTAARWIMLFHTPIPHQGLMMRRSTAEAVGGYREDQRSALDYELECRLARLGKLANLPEPLVDAYSRPGGITQTRWEEQHRIVHTISSRQMAQMLGRSHVSHEERALANHVRIGLQPQTEHIAPAMRTLMALARRYAREQPQFVADVLDGLCLTHARALGGCLRAGRPRGVLRHAAVLVWVSCSRLGGRPLRHLGAAVRAELAHAVRAIR